jgi:CRP/FNR family transcriptional regulator, cyclic AMP receptor protein
MAKKKKYPFSVNTFLSTVDGGRTLASYGKNQKIFSQGERADSVFYIREGKVKVYVISEQGKEAVVALHGNGDFFGEGCLTGQPLRLATAVAMTESVIMRLDKVAIVRVLQTSRSSPRCSCRTFWLATLGSKRTWSTSSSIRARSVWRGCSS